MDTGYDEALEAEASMALGYELGEPGNWQELRAAVLREGGLAAFKVDATGHSLQTGPRWSPLRREDVPGDLFRLAGGQPDVLAARLALRFGLWEEGDVDGMLAVLRRSLERHELALASNPDPWAFQAPRLAELRRRRALKRAA